MNAYDKNEKYVIAIGPIAVDEYYDALEWPKEGAKEIIKPTSLLAKNILIIYHIFSHNSRILSYFLVG